MSNPEKQIMNIDLHTTGDARLAVYTNAAGIRFVVEVGGNQITVDAHQAQVLLLARTALG